MHRLSQLDDRQRRLFGSSVLLLGVVLMALGIVFAHYAGFPETETIDGVERAVEVDYLGWIPRGWLPVTMGQLVAVAGSQLAIGGALLLWVANQPMTWARAGFAALLTWIELVLIFGIIPSEWLNLSQGPLEMTGQRIAFTIPPWLVLGNEVSISMAAIKDAVSGTYNLVMLGAAIVFGYKIQDWGKKKPTAVQKESLYGRPLVKGER
jgi:hypothetical protein